MLQGVGAVRESTTYQAILQEGRQEGREEGWRDGWRAGWREGRREDRVEVILRLGSQRFGGPDARTRESIEQVASLEQLTRWTDRLLTVESWEELIGRA